MERKQTYSFWSAFWAQFLRRPMGVVALIVVIIFCLMGIYAPFLASSKPILVIYNGELYFPLFRYLFYQGFYTKRLDLFFNLLIFTFPFFLLSMKVKWGKWLFFTVLIVQMAGFFYFAFRHSVDPAMDPLLLEKRKEVLSKEYSNPQFQYTWDFELSFLTPYAKLNAVLRYDQRKTIHETLKSILKEEQVPSLWQKALDNENSQIKSLEASSNVPDAMMQIQFLMDRRKWLEEESGHLQLVIMPLLSSYHWEDDAGGSQALNRQVDWWNLTRINRKDLISALIFGTRISLVVGVISVAIALMIGVPLGSLAGYYGGKFDILMFRLVEIWESMPTFFMLLLIVAVLQSKSIFLVISIIGFFGWTNFCRYIRGEFFKQRSLPYIEACHSLGYRDPYIIFRHILPNAVPPLLTLLPFSIMAAITSEAGLSFLGLGEEGSCSWGVLMDEGRTAFPGESYLLWPPALLLTILLVSIAIVGDTLRDALDPKLHLKAAEDL